MCPYCIFLLIEYSVFLQILLVGSSNL